MLRVGLGFASRQPATRRRFDLRPSRQLRLNRPFLARRRPTHPTTPGCVPVDPARSMPPATRRPAWPPDHASSSASTLAASSRISFASLLRGPVRLSRRVRFASVSRRSPPVRRGSVPRSRTSAAPDRTTPPERVLMGRPEPGDGRVIRNLVRSQHPEGDILGAAPLDDPAGTFTDAIRVHQQRHHQRRVVRGAAPTISPVRRHERDEVELLDDVQHEPRQMISWKPLRQRRRQQEQLIAITSHEVVSHDPSSHRARNQGAIVNIRATASDRAIWRRRIWHQVVELR